MTTTLNNLDPTAPTETTTSVQNRSLPYFIAAAILWLMVGVLLCWMLTPSAESPRRAMTWLGLLAGICLLDLYALSQALSGLFDLMRSDAGKPLFLVIRTSYWGGIKLVCVIFLGFLMKSGTSGTSGAQASSGSGIPSVGLLTGVSTLVAVPLLGFVLLMSLEKRRGCDKINE
jgi:hypothetical protein